MSSPAAGGGPAPRPAARPNSRAEKALVVGSPEWVEAKEAKQAARIASEKATVPAPAAPEHYVPPNVKGNANGQTVDGTTFFPGMSSAEVKAFFTDCAKKERNYNYMRIETQKRGEFMLDLYPSIDAIKENYPFIALWSAKEIVKMLIPSDGWQSCHIAMAVENRHDILANRMMHLNEYFSTKPIPDSIATAIQARAQLKEEADAKKIALEESASVAAAQLAFLTEQLAQSQQANFHANQLIGAMLPQAIVCQAISMIEAANA